VVVIEEVFVRFSLFSRRILPLLLSTDVMKAYMIVPLGRFGHYRAQNYARTLRNRAITLRDLSAPSEAIRGGANEGAHLGVHDHVA
jgi:hypothetical protein